MDDSNIIGGITYILDRDYFFRGDDRSQYHFPRDILEAITSGTVVVAIGMVLVCFLSCLGSI